MAQDKVDQTPLFSSLGGTPLRTGKLATRSWPLLTFALLLLGLGPMSCKCGDPPLSQTDGGTACKIDADCQSTLGARFLCLEGTCCPGPRYCDVKGEADCCPGQTCNRGDICVDKYDACSVDADCATEGQRCLTHANSAGGAAACQAGSNETLVCTYEGCLADGKCAAGLNCFSGFCVGISPCGGSCPAGQACSVSNDRCQPGPNPSCEQSCDPGFLLAFKDADNIDDSCDLEAVSCECLALPPLTALDVGRHSALGLLADGSALVSAFEGDHGDLVVVKFAADGTRQETTWVDGLPTGGVPEADPNGPRGGIADPGPEVGRYTDIAIAAGDVVNVSYYDVDNGDLRFAQRVGANWTLHTVDGAGDVGRYSAIGLDGAGVPVIAYFQAAGEGSDLYTTALKVARAKSITPSAATDWDIVTVESLAVQPPPCGPGCVAGEACVDPGTGSAACVATRTDCAAACGSNEQCVDDGAGTGLCKAELKPSSLVDLPLGTGLFPALWVTSGGSITVAYHDRNAGALKLAVGVDPAASGTGSISTIEGGVGTPVGLFPAIALTSSGDYALVYRDAAATQLRWAQVTAAGAKVDGGVVDDGLRDPSGNGVSFVGSDNALLLEGGRWEVAYHDGTGGDLLLAVRATDGTWSHRELATTGSAGFWADIAFAGGQLRVSHATLLGTRSGPLNTDLSLVLTTP